MDKEPDGTKALNLNDLRRHFDKLPTNKFHLWQKSFVFTLFNENLANYCVFGMYFRTVSNTFLNRQKLGEIISSTTKATLTFRDLSTYHVAVVDNLALNYTYVW